MTLTELYRCKVDQLAESLRTRKHPAKDAVTRP